jgi:protein pelota
MRTLKKDLKHGLMTLRIENSDDLWHLQHILHEGDLIKTKTMRKVAVKAGGEYRLGDKKPMVLTIRLEKSTFDETSGTLRLSGKIVEGPADTRLSSYHTLSIEPGTVITVKKDKWGPSVMKRISESGTREPRVLVCVMDREEADVAFVRGSGIRDLAHIECEDPDKREAYHRELLHFLAAQNGYSVIVIAGPGFEAGNLVKYVRKNSPDLAPKCVSEGASHTGITGISEVMKKSGDRILRDTRIGRESELVDEVLARIRKDGLVTYGREEVKRAVESGASETLIVSREKISEFENLMELAERMKSRVRLVTADHPSGEQFMHLGGIAALLRFRLQ